MILTTPQRSTVLAALRSFQSLAVQDGFEMSADINDIATNGGEHDPLTNDEIEALCQKINTEDECSALPWSDEDKVISPGEGFSNDQRADQAMAGIEAYAALVGQHLNEEDETNISDMLASMMHLARRQGWNFSALLQTATMHHDAESQNLGT